MFKKQSKICNLETTIIETTGSFLSDRQWCTINVKKNMTNACQNVGPPVIKMVCILLLNENMFLIFLF